jgi:hypothetical protein
VPVVLGFMARLMLVPPPDLRRACDLPGSVVREAFTRPEGRQLIADSMRKVRELCEELGLMTPLSRRAWAVMGLSDRRMAAPAAGAGDAAETSAAALGARR